MRPRHTRLLANALAASWLLLVSALPVIAYAPDFINADTVLGSIMSLQNVTLYFWGQNRLLNILPFAVSWITDPQSNLLALLYLASLATFSLLLLLALFARRAVAGRSDLVLPVFAALSATYLLVASPHGIYLMSIAHPEYALALLLAGAGVYVVWFAAIGAPARLALAVPPVLLAIGLNPATAIPLSLTLAVASLYRRRISGPDAILFAIVVGGFVGWSAVSRLHGSESYNAFSADDMAGKLARATGSIAEMAQPSAVAALALALLAGLAVRRWRVRRGPGVDPTPAAIPAVAALCLFGALWFLLFSTNRWVEMNAFSSRYFIPVAFALVAVAAIGWAGVLRDVAPRIRAAIVVPLVAAAIIVTATPIRPITDFVVFRTVAPLPRSPSGLYAGDYWRAWPAVFRDLMAGHEAYGLTYRGEGNQKAVRRHVRAELATRGTFTLLCIGDPVEACAGEAGRILGRSTITASAPAGPDAMLLTMTSRKASAPRHRPARRHPPRLEGRPGRPRGGVVTQRTANPYRRNSLRPWRWSALRRSPGGMPAGTCPRRARPVVDDSHCRISGEGS